MSKTHIDMYVSNDKKKKPFLPVLQGIILIILGVLIFLFPAHLLAGFSLCYAPLHTF